MTIDSQNEKVELGHAALLESLLFVSSGPVTPARLAKALEITPGAVESLLRDLEGEYAGRGLRLQWTPGGCSSRPRRRRATRWNASWGWR
jgi:chromosome segregation and condensation protein ScpB